MFLYSKYPVFHVFPNFCGGRRIIVPGAAAHCVHNTGPSNVVNYYLDYMYIRAHVTYVGYSLLFEDLARDPSSRLLDGLFSAWT